MLLQQQPADSEDPEQVDLCLEEKGWRQFNKTSAGAGGLPSRTAHLRKLSPGGRLSLSK